MKKLLQYVLPAVVVAGFSFAAPSAANAHDMRNHRMMSNHHMMHNDSHCKMMKSKHWDKRHHRWVWTTKRICR